MLAVRQFPELATRELLARLLASSPGYDGEGRASSWLWVGGAHLAPELKEIALAVCPQVPLGAWQGALIQCYRDGQTGTPCHSDFGSTGLGFILSLGAARTFRTHRVPLGVASTPGCGDYDLDAVLAECVNGTAVIMDEEFHRGHHHQIVPDGGAGERVALVFRTAPEWGKAAS